MSTGFDSLFEFRSFNRCNIELGGWRCDLAPYGKTTVTPSNNKVFKALARFYMYGPFQAQLPLSVD